MENRFSRSCILGFFILLCILLIVSACEKSQAENPLHRIAFGSCAKRWLEQPIWNTIAESKPDLFLFIGDASKVEAQAEVVYKIIDAYEGKYVSTGRTLAEIINLPATILSKMAFISGMLDHTEGPVPQAFKETYADLLQETAKVDAEYSKAVKAELAMLNKLMK